MVDYIFFNGLLEGHLTSINDLLIYLFAFNNEQKKNLVMLVGLLLGQYFGLVYIVVSVSV